MKLVYIAGPFRGANHWEIAKNVRDAEHVALAVWLAGAAALCPHANSANFQDAAPDQVFLNGSLEMLRRCDAVVLGKRWQDSQGTLAEIQEACSLCIPVFEYYPAFRYEHGSWQEFLAWLGTC